MKYKMTFEDYDKKCEEYKESLSEQLKRCPIYESLPIPDNLKEIRNYPNYIEYLMWLNALVELTPKSAEIQHLQELKKCINQQLIELIELD